jgi:type IV pilus assembly protein PilO
MPLKNRNLSILVGSIALVCAVIYIYWSFVYSPLEKTMVVARKNVEDLTDKLVKAKARAGQLAKIQSEMASLQLDVAQLEKQLPKDRELPSLIRVFTHRAEAYGLTLASFAPGKPVPKGLYDEIPYTVSLSASFHSLGHFLTAMGKGERLFAARNLALSPAGQSKDMSKTVNATFTLIAFKYHE